MSLPGADPSQTRLQAQRAMAAGDPAAARVILERAPPASRDLPHWLGLAAACRAARDFDAAMAAVEGALKLDPRDFMALLMKASLLERLGKARASATAYGVALTQAPDDALLDPPTLRAVRHARDLNGAYTRELAEFLHARVRSTGAAAGAAERGRADGFVDFVLGRRKRYSQEPTQYFYPGRPAIEFYDRDEFPFLAALEARTPEIRAELMDVLRSDAGLEPYVAYSDDVPLDQWTALNNSADWSAFHFSKAGERIEANCARCPATVEAIGLLPQPKVRNRSPAAMFSILKPHTRIPPHTGVANTRLVLHLPLVVPPGCGFRVGAETRPWVPGEAWVFDDTIDHEAWNDSDQVRAILICDVWQPRLTPAERDLVTTVMESIDSFNDNAPEAGL